MSSIRANSVLAMLVGATALATEAAAAADAPPRDPAMAETLFADAKKRMSAGDYATACPKLAESYRLDPGTGTLAALALCHEQMGKTATAWAEFIQVVTEAQQAGRADREKYARQHVAALEPTLSRLTIVVAPETARLAGVHVRRDDVVVGQAAWGVDSPVDPGEHTIEVEAWGKAAWSSHVTLLPRGDAKTVAVPPLDDAGGNPTMASEKSPSSAARGENAVAPQASPSTASGGTQRTLGLALGVAGLASIGVGAYFGIQALSESNTAKRTCSPASCTDPSAVHANDIAKSDALAADITWAAGLAGLGLGALIYFMAPRDSAASDPRGTSAPEKTSAWRVVPAFETRGGGLIVRGMW